MITPRHSTTPNPPVPTKRDRLHERIEDLRRGFVEFLTIPSLVVACFILLAIAMFYLDRLAGQKALGELFSDEQGTRDFLGVIAGGIITVTSITFSLLLLAVQQGAMDLTSVIFDQFLRRRTNQFFFGFFTGLAIYSLIILTSVSPSHQPVFGAAMAGVLTVVSLCMLIFLIYTTVNQMRPVVIIRTIHDHTLVARQNQQALLRQTSWPPQRRAGAGKAINADRSGFMTGVDIAGLAGLAEQFDAEIVILPSIGDYVAFGDPLAEIVNQDDSIAEETKNITRNAIHIESQRDLDEDPAFGVEQLVTIGWTSISSAKSDPEPGLLTIWNMRDLLARWLREDAAFGHSARHEGESRIAYCDNLSGDILRGFQSMVVAASESLQHQCAAEIYLAFAQQYPILSPEPRAEMADITLRSLAALGDHVPTTELDAALQKLAEVMKDLGQVRTAAAISAAHRQLSKSIGQLHSRASRKLARREVPLKK